MNIKKKIQASVKTVDTTPEENVYEGQIMIAMYDYQAQDDDEISLKVGDKGQNFDHHLNFLAMILYC